MALAPSQSGPRRAASAWLKSPMLRDSAPAGEASMSPHGGAASLALGTQQTRGCSAAPAAARARRRARGRAGSHPGSAVPPLDGGARARRRGVSD